MLSSETRAIVLLSQAAGCSTVFPTEGTATRISTAPTDAGLVSSTVSRPGPWNTSWRIDVKLYDGTPEIQGARGAKTDYRSGMRMSRGTPTRNSGLMLRES